MKTYVKFVVAGMLGLLARAVVRRYKPAIVMVTGSVGKTSTKDAVAAALGARFFVRKSEKSFNSELGVPFTILGVGNPWGNPAAWLAVFRRAFALLLLPSHYPAMLVLEVGADQPGDLARILRMVTPDAVVVTRLPEVPVHVEAYATPEAVREEEALPALALRAGAPLIVSADDRYALEAAARTDARVWTFGTSEDAHVRVTHLQFWSDDTGATAGMQASLETDGEAHSVAVPGAVGFTQLFPLAAAMAAANAFSIPNEEALEALKTYEPPLGRGRLLHGVEGSVLIDDTYNASPAAVEEALATLRAYPNAGRRIAVLGDMLELGRFSVSEHERIGALVGDSADVVVTIGVRARGIAASALQEHDKDKTVLSFDTAQAAIESVQALLQPGDVVLLKGSQGVRMERLVAALLAEPADAKAMLVRQDRQWLRRA